MISLSQNNKITHRRQQGHVSENHNLHLSRPHTRARQYSANAQVVDTAVSDGWVILSVDNRSDGNLIVSSVGIQVSVTHESQRHSRSVSRWVGDITAVNTARQGV